MTNKSEALLKNAAETGKIFLISRLPLRALIVNRSKSSDRTTFSLQNNNDEVEKFLNGYYISSLEVLWRIFQFPIHERFPAVVHFAVHLENGQRV